MWPAENFNRREFACKCGCGGDTVDAELLAVLAEIRAELGPVFVVSGYRCAKHNTRVGGAATSQHLAGKAADIVVRGVSPGVVAAFISGRWMDMYGVGDYPSFTHIDVRPIRTRWRG